MSLGEPRREYLRDQLDEHSVAADPLKQLRIWLEDATAAGVREPTAMTLASATVTGQPSARTVLLKGLGEGELVFYTDYRSRKAGELDQNPQACLLFFWPELERQIRIEGTASRVATESSARYFSTRPVGSRLGAWASRQSAVLSGGRAELEAAVEAVRTRFGEGDIPLPPHWGGYRLAPTEFEFWQGRENRLHDRIRYRRRGEAWVIDRLSP